MKICLFTDTLCDLNGVSRFLQDMANSAIGSQKEFYIITSTKKKHCDKLSNIINIDPLLSIPMPFYKELNLVLPSYKKMKKHIENIKPDIIHISTPGPVGYIGRKIAKEFSLPMVGTYHTNFPAYIYSNTKLKFLQSITENIMKKFYNDFKKIIIRSEEYRDVLNEDIKIPQENIDIIPAGINIELFDKKFIDDKIWQEYGIKERFKFLYVGRISKEKNIDFLLEVWDEISSKMDAALIMVGDGSYLKYKYDKVYFLGNRSKQQLAPIYASSDLFVFPSNTDTLGQVVMEAQSSALCAVVSDKGGPKTIIESGQKSGYALSTEKSKWADLLVDLYFDDSKRKIYGEAGYHKMRSRPFLKSFEKFWQIHEQIIDIDKGSGD